MLLWRYFLHGLLLVKENLNQRPTTVRWVASNSQMQAENYVPPQSPWGFRHASPDMWGNSSSKVLFLSSSLIPEYTHTHTPSLSLALENFKTAYKGKTTWKKCPSDSVTVDVIPRHSADPGWVNFSLLKETYLCSGDFSFYLLRRGNESRWYSTGQNACLVHTEVTETSQRVKWKKERKKKKSESLTRGISERSKKWYYWQATPDGKKPGESILTFKWYQRNIWVQSHRSL